MAQQDTDQQHAGVLPVDDEGFVIDTEQAEERELAYRERGTSRPITVVGNPVLHKECKDVTEFGDELLKLVDDMFASQHTAEGVGLAANQIGVDLKVFVYDCPDDEGVRHTGVVCNPKLVELPADRLRATGPPRLRRGDRSGREGQSDQGARHRVLRSVFAARDRSPVRIPLHRPAVQARTQGRAAPDGRERAPLRRGRQRLSDIRGDHDAWPETLPVRRRSYVRRMFDRLRTSADP